MARLSRRSVYPFLKTLRLEIIREIIRSYQEETNTPARPFMNLTVDQLQEIKSTDLVDIGAHTLNHPILSNESDETATREISKSIDDLGDILNRETKYFAYPNGRYGVDFGMREIAFLKKKRIRLAFSEEKGVISADNHPLCIPRSGSPLVLQNNYKQSFKYPLVIAQLLFGERRYYDFVKTIKSIKDRDR
jgi:peptidoglycan/xylan/chitin deacetylase (PgdA/CDA1 family)